MLQHQALHFELEIPLNQHSFTYEDVLYLCHALVLIHRHKLVTHAMNQKDRHSELGMVDLIPLRPVLATHHGSQDKWRNVEGIALLQQLLLFGALTGKSSSKGVRERRRYS